MRISRFRCRLSLSFSSFSSKISVNLLTGVYSLHAKNSNGAVILFHSRVATSLPLPEDAENKRPRIDFVVLFIDLTNTLR